MHVCMYGVKRQRMSFVIRMGFHDHLPALTNAYVIYYLQLYTSIRVSGYFLFHFSYFSVSYLCYLLRYDYICSQLFHIVFIVNSIIVYVYYYAKKKIMMIMSFGGTYSWNTSCSMFTLCV